MASRVVALVEHPASDGVIRLVGDRQPRGRVEVVHRQLARHAVRARVDLLDEALRLVVLVGDLPDQLLEQILEGHQPGRAAVLVDDDGDVQLLGLEFLQQRVRALGFRHEIRRVKLAAQIEVGRQPAHVRQKVFRVEHADDHVDGALEHGHARVQLLAQRGQDLRHRRLDVQAEHVRPGHHDRADQRVLELEDLVDHLALFALHHALARAHVDQRAQLFLAERRLRLRAAPQQTHGQRGQAGQHATDRREQPLQPSHRPLDDGEEALGIFHRERHRQHLAEGRQQDDHRDQLDEQAPARPEQRVRGVRGQRRGADVDERDADEQRDEQVVRARHDRRQGALGPLGGDTAQPRAPEREVRGFGPREQTRGDDEGAEQQQLQDQAVTHGSARIPAPPPRRARGRRATACRSPP